MITSIYLVQFLTHKVAAEYLWGSAVFYTGFTMYPGI